MAKNENKRKASPLENDAAVYNNKMHLYGRVWTLLALAALLSVPALFCVYLGVWPQASGVFKGLAKVAPLFYATAIVEIIAYTPLLGTGGMYLSFVTGNISNLKLPCALAAMDGAKVKPNSEEGEVVTTISIAVSSIVTTVIIAVCVLIFKPILPYLTRDDSVFAPAFRQVLPALFGALGATYFAKNWKISLLPVLALTLLLVFSGGIAAGTLVPVGVVIAILWALLLWKTGKL